MSFRMATVLILLLAAMLLFSGSGNPSSQICDAGDLDSDGKSEEYALTDHVLTVKEDGQDIWKSPKNYHVDSFVLGDINNDGKVNLVISLWKKGSFGEMRPFWHTDKDVSYKNHLFVYQLQENTFKPVWFSSDLDRPILSFEIRDVNGDDRNELVVAEGQYKKIAEERYAPNPKGQVRTTVWKWEEWGFQRCDSN